jgi:hypothetical protein
MAPEAVSKQARQNQRLVELLLLYYHRLTSPASGPEASFSDFFAVALIDGRVTVAANLGKSARLRAWHYKL